MSGELAIEGVFLSRDWDDDIDGPSLIEGERSEKNTKRYHVDCAVDVDVELACPLLKRKRDRPPAVAAAYTLAVARRKAINALARARRMGAAPGARNVVDIEPARDRKGRPRVTVVVVGSAATSNSHSWNTITELAHDFAITSPLREYVLEPFVGNSSEQIARDPSQPLVAAVFAVLDDVKIVKAQRDKLAALRALGTPPPLLWVIGNGTTDPKHRDQKVLELREELARVGFSADDAIALCSRTVDEASLRELALTLDSAGSRANQPKSFVAVLENAVSAVEQAIRDEGREQLAPLLEHIVTLLFARLDPASLPAAVERLLPERAPLPLDLAARIRAAASSALRETTAREAALTLLSHVDVRSDAAVVDALLRAMVEEKGRTFHRSFQSATKLLGRWNAARLHRFAADAMVASATGKSRLWQLDALLASCADREIAAQLRAFASSTTKKDPRAPMAEARATQIEARARETAKKTAGSPQPPAQPSLADS